MNVKLTLMREIKKTEIETVDQSETVTEHFTIPIINVWIRVTSIILVFMSQFGQENHPSSLFMFLN